MTPYPGDFGAYVLEALPYAAAEALRIAGWCIAVVAPVAVACWLLARARRALRLLDSLMDDGDGQGGIPDLPRRTRPMSLAEQDAVNGRKLGELTGPDHVVTGQLAAVQDALTPRMVAPTRADLRAIRQRCTRCRTGNPQLPCMCGYDCYAADCLAETPGGHL